MKHSEDGSHSGTPYDDVFRTMMNDCLRLVIPVINEIFGKGYSGSETIIPYPNEHFMSRQDGPGDKRITDSAFVIMGETADHYLLECQSKPDNSMTPRMFEYGTQIGLDHAIMQPGQLDITLPGAAILFLRGGRKLQTELPILIRADQKEMDYPVHVLCVQHLNSDYIISKNMIFLVPFFIFAYERKFSSFPGDTESMGQMLHEFATIKRWLDRCVEENKLDYLERRTIQDMTMTVVNGIAKNYQLVRKEIDKIMGGQVLEYEAKTIYREGRQEGRLITLDSLVRDGIISLEDAASRMKMTPEEFRACLADIPDDLE